jgi:hypothetical protein
MQVRDVSKLATWGLVVDFATGYVKIPSATLSLGKQMEEKPLEQTVWLVLQVSGTESTWNTWRFFGEEIVGEIPGLLELMQGMVVETRPTRLLKERAEEVDV